VALRRSSFQRLCYARKARANHRVQPDEGAAEDEEDAGSVDVGDACDGKITTCFSVNAALPPTQCCKKPKTSCRGGGGEGRGGEKLTGLSRRRLALAFRRPPCLLLALSACCRSCARRGVCGVAASRASASVVLVRHANDCAFEDAQERLLHAFARHVF
jgi:hypothetical protein